MARKLRRRSWRSRLRAVAALVGLLAVGVAIYVFTPAWTVLTTPTSTGYSILKPPPGALIYCGTNGRWTACAAVYPNSMYYSYVAYHGLHVAWPVNIVWKRGWGVAAS